MEIRTEIYADNNPPSVYVVGEEEREYANIRIVPSVDHCDPEGWVIAGDDRVSFLKLDDAVAEATRRVELKVKRQAKARTELKEMLAKQSSTAH